MNILILDTINKTIKAKLAEAATTQPVWTAHCYDSLETNVEEMSNDGEFNSTTTITIVSAPVSGKKRVVKEITVYNGDSIDHTVTLYLDNNGTQRIIWRGVVTASGTLLLSQLTSMAAGAAGEGLSPGGLEGEYFIKNSGTDYDASWGKLRISQEGSKSSSSSSGMLGELSVDDDFIYICVSAGTAGSATWKRFQLHQT